MLTNASITRIDRKTGSTPAGRPKITEGGAIASNVLRCFVDAVTSRQRYTLGATIEDADHTCFVEHGELAIAGETSPEVGDVLQIVVDNGVTYSADVIHSGEHTTPRAGRLSHVELYLRRAPRA